MLGRKLQGNQGVSDRGNKNSNENNNLGDKGSANENESDYRLDLHYFQLIYMRMIRIYG